MADDQYLLRVACGLPGHETDWIEFDTSGWTLADFRQVYYANLVDALRVWVERDSTAWHLTGNNGTVQHPGRGALAAKWLAAYRALGDEWLTLDLVRWLGTTPLFALNQRLEVPKKSPAGSARPGEGRESAGVAGDTDGASGGGDGGGGVTT